MTSSQIHTFYLVLKDFLSRFMRSPPKPNLASAQPLPSPPKKDSAYQKVTADVHEIVDSNVVYWWQTSGYLLATLLHDAGYPPTSQEHILNFFGRTIAPYLGSTYNIHSPQWRSFMTDDHHPIELSWDWHTGQKAPTVRFSIEPVGVHAGTPLDPSNTRADTFFRHALTEALPDIEMDQFRYFDRVLTPHLPRGLMEGHASRIFYAFDLTAESITSKAYFFPGFKAQETGQTNLQVIADVVTRAPKVSPKQLRALQAFEGFTQDPSTPSLEIDMLAIDMDSQPASRLKIYFRSRATSFASVRQMMTLGLRINRPEIDRGLDNLRRLWDALLVQKGVPDRQPLPDNDHRTAGLLYNIELPPNSTLPLIKIYIPVRHYASCDEQILSAVHEYMETRHGNRAPLNYGYADTMRSLFHHETLQQRGLHTYIACSIQSSGELRVVSYINCQGYKMVRGYRKM
ncbi:aromatic prenyltransferase [Aspergillus filifer]